MKTLKETIMMLAMAVLPAGVEAQSLLKMVVGTYTDGSSRGIYSFTLDQETGHVQPLDTLDVKNPSYLTISKDGTRIYSVSENNDATACVNAIRFDASTGKMTWMNSQLTHGEDPCFVETNGKLLLTANYTGGSMSVFPLAVDGSLLPMTQQFGGTTAPSDMPQQSQPHIHCTRFAPDGHSVIATDFSANRLLRYHVLPNGRLETAGVAGTLLRNSGCRHFVWSDDHRFVYVISELGGTVTVFENSDNTMERIQVIASDTVGGHGSADIHLSPDGRFLYASNRLKSDGIAIFSVDRQTGLLTRKGYQLTGLHPRNFNITPNGRFLLCACRDSNVIQVFRIDPQTGLLTDTHQDIRMDKPVCVKFY